MRKVPDITTSHPDIVVDEVRHRAPFLGFIGEERWEVCWRCVSDPRLRGRTLLGAGTLGGSAALGSVDFTFVIRWRENRRRPRSGSIERNLDKNVVTPGAVLQLAEIRKSR